MCLIVDSKKKIPTKARWAYKTLIVRGMNRLESTSQAFFWTPGKLHIARGTFSIDNHRVNGGVIHCFTTVAAAKQEMVGYNYPNEYVVRVRVPEHCVRCVGFYNSAKVENIGAQAVFLPEAGYLLHRGKWTNAAAVLKQKKGK